MNYNRTNELINQIKSAINGSGPKIVTWADGTDEEICTLIDALDNDEISIEDLGWDVGDERVVTLNAISSGTYNVAHASQQITLVIMDVSSYNGVGHFIVGFKQHLIETEKMETSNTNANGWRNSRGRNCCDAIFNGMIPSSIKPIFKKVNIYTAVKGGSNTATVSNNYSYLALFAEKEIFGVKSRCAKSEFDSSNVHDQLEWFKTSANRNPGTSNIWQRSPYYNNTSNFCTVTTADASNYTSASTALGMAPFMVM